MSDSAELNKDATSTDPATEIAASVTTLTELVLQLTTKLTNYGKRSRYMAVIALVGLVLDICLTVAGGFLVHNALEAQKQIRENSVAISQQQETLGSIQTRFAVDGVCPLYDIILTGYNPKSPNALANPKLYDTQFGRFEHSAVALGCPHTKRGPVKP